MGMENLLYSTKRRNGAALLGHAVATESAPVA